MKNNQSIKDALDVLLKHLPGVENLDSRKDGEQNCIPEKGDAKVPKIRRPYNVNGKQVWITGKSEQEICDQFAVLLMESKGIVPNTKERKTLESILDVWFVYKKEYKKIGVYTIRTYDLGIRSIKAHFGKAYVHILKLLKPWSETWLESLSRLDK